MRALGLAILTASIVATGLAAQDKSHASHVSAALEPHHEVPVVLSPAAEGDFTAVIDDDAQMIHYRLTFTGLQAPVTQSHIHIAQPDVNGSIVVWFCQTAAAPDPVNTATQQCPVGGGTITGTIVPTDVRAVPTQGLAPALSASEKFERLVSAIRAGNAYANVHTTQSPAGEIRGQIRVGGGHK